MSSPTDRRYTRTHEWVRVEDDIATLGITDYAQTELGDITYLELPESGESVSAGSPFGVVESVKAASDIYSPIDGEVIERNEAAIEAPEIVNQSPYGDAWLVKVRLGDPAQVENLMAPQEYDSFAAESAH